MRRSLAIALILLATTLALAGPALASKPRCRLERIDPGSLADGKLRLYASTLELEGEVVGGIPARQFTLLVNNKRAGHPEKVQLFSAAKEPVYVALVVEVAAQFKPALENVKAALKDFLEDQSPLMKVSLITFGSNVEPRTHFVPARSLVDPIDNLEPDEDSVEVQMANAVRSAVQSLKKLQPSPNEPGKMPPRRLIVLVSDGLNARMDRATFRDLGTFAFKEGVAIHSVAFSASDSRGPLLNLGDLSKRSNGTFRWARKAEDLKPQLDTLADEVRKQYVLTFPVDFSSTENRKLGLLSGELRCINSGLGPPPPPPGRSWWEWVLILLGGVIALLAILFVLGLILRAREAKSDTAHAPAPVMRTPRTRPRTPRPPSRRQPY